MAPKDVLEISFSWAEIASLLFKAQGIESGLWQVAVGLRFAGLNSGPADDSMLPTALVAFEKIGLVRASAPGPMVFDASSLVATGGRASRKKSKASAELTTRIKAQEAK